MKILPRLGALPALFVCAMAAHADGLLRAPEVIVSAPAGDGTLRTAPHGVSVITADDLARAPSTSLADVLSREANVNLQSYFGGDRGATLDLRGMGAAASSNVLVLVDGERLNEADLSGADLSAVSLSQLERVEIVRGGGAVRYGDGAVGGVVHLRTRRAHPGPLRAELGLRAGAYDTRDARVSLTGGPAPWSVAVQAAAHDTDGFRRNGDTSARDAALELRTIPERATGLVDAWLRATAHEDEGGLPGPVSEAEFASGTAGRRGTRSPLDRTATRDQRVGAGATLDFGSAGTVDLRAHWRERRNPWRIGLGTTLPADVSPYEGAIESRRREAELQYERGAVDGPLTLAAGLAWRDGAYVRQENGTRIVDSSLRRDGSLDGLAQWATAVWRPAATIAINAGVRHERFATQRADARYTRAGCTTVFDTVLVDIGGGVFVPVSVPRQTGCVDAFRQESASGAAWHRRAAELGLSWEANRDVVLFASATSHFRHPNLDELVLAAADLRPQTGRTLEAGFRVARGGTLEFGATVFRTDITDEIQYGRDPATGLAVNRNLGAPTRRIGGETEVRWRAGATITLRANAGYVAPRMIGRDFDVPLVPRTTANAAVDWRFLPAWLATLSARHAGGRVDGNEDGNGSFPRLPAYAVWDAALHWERGRLRLSCGVNNLFDRAYSTIAYSGTLYPMPERNAWVALRWQP